MANTTWTQVAGQDSETDVDTVIVTPIDAPSTEWSQVAGQGGGAYVDNVQDLSTAAVEAAAATAADRVQTGLDAAATAADRVQTGLDAAATAADVASIAGSEAATAADLLATDADTVATAADRVQTGLDAAATAADRAQTALDAADTAADLLLTDADTVATAADRVQTGLDAAATAADAASTAADVASTAADAAATAADLLATDADTVATAADRVQTGLDAAATAADRVATNQDAIDTAADAASTAADRAAVEGVTADVLFESELASPAAVKATTGTFLVADETKLDGIEALADVTDTANVTAAGALMDSELTSIASVKALNQGVATTNSPTFAKVTAGDMNITGPTPILKLTDNDVDDEFTIIQNESGNTLIDTRKGDSDGQFIVRGKGEGVITEHFRANANGVGIFNPSPSAALDVVGDIEVTGMVDGRDIAADGVALDNFASAYNSDKVIYQVSPVVPERVGNPTWFPSGGAPYLNTIIAADGPSDTDIVWRSVLIGDSVGSEVATMSQAVAVGNGAMRFSGTSDATTAIGSLSLQWLGLTLAGGEDNSDAMVRTRHDFVTDNRLDDVLWDGFGLETALPGTRAKLDAVVIPTVASSLEGNTAVGRNSGLHIVKGYDNTLMGRNALAHGFDSTENVAIGNRALRDGALANQNVAVGTAAGQSFIDGSDNIFIGDHAGFYTTTGSNNLMLGSWAGDGFTGAVDNNLFIGMGTGATPLVSGDFSAGRVGINVAYADHLGQGLHVRAGTSATGAVPNSASDALVVEQSGASTGISILTDNTEVGQVNFADPQDNNDGYLRYDHATREMSIGAANAERMSFGAAGAVFNGDATFNTSGNNGFNINSVNPAIQLTDTDTSESSRLWHSGTSVYLDNTGTGNTIFRNGATSTQRVNIKSSGDVSFRDSTGATEDFYWDASAVSLGIGTSSPSAALDVVGDIKASGSLTAGDMFITGPTPILTLTDNDVADESTKIQNASGNTLVDTRNGASDGQFIVRGQGGGVTTEHLRVNANGVGIFNSSPSAALDVIGDIEVSGKLSLGDEVLSKAVYYTTSQNAPYMIAGTTGYTGATTSWGTYGFQHRIKSDASGTARVTIDSFSGEAFYVKATGAGNTVGALGDLVVSGDTYFGNPPDGLPSNNASGEGAVMSSSGKLSILGDADWCLGLGRHTTSGPLQYFYYSGSVVGSIAVTASATNYNTSSDYRLKEDWQPMVGASDRVMALNPVNFAWKLDGSRVDGFLAHEVQSVAPEVVTGEKDAVDVDGVPEMQAIDQSKLVPLLTAALQEALTKIDALEARVAAMENL